MADKTVTTIALTQEDQRLIRSIYERFPTGASRSFLLRAGIRALAEMDTGALGEALKAQSVADRSARGNDGAAA